MSSVWFLFWLVCFRTAVVSFREVPLDLRRNGTRLTVRRRPWLSGQETKNLTDGWIDTCIEAKPQKEGGSQMPISVELAECADITTVDFSVRGSSSQSYYARLKQPCSGDISTVQELTCEHAVDKSPKYNCSAQVSPAVLKHVVVFVPVGITVCELNIYRSGRAEDPASSAPSIVLSTTSAAKVLPATGNCMTFAVDLGSTLLVHCNASGFPFPKYRWQSHHSEYISNSGRVKATTDGSLKLKQLMRSDSGRYECRAINSEGEDKKCIQVNVYVPRPTNIHVVNITEESAVVTWNQPVRSSIQDVLILFANRTNNRTRKSRVVNLQHGIEWSATLENLTALTCYTFQIRVNTTKGLKPERISETREFITSGSLVHKLQASTGSRSAVISWKIPSDLCDPVSSYDIQYFKLDGSKAVPVSSPALNKQSVSLSGLTPYIRYRVEVVAIVMSVRTNKMSHEFRTKQAAPSPPRDVSIRDVYSRRATVTWLPPLRMNGQLKEYRVFLANVRHSTVSRSVREDTITGLTPNTQYKVWIAAVNAIGMQDLISPLQSVSFKTKPEASSPPRNVSYANVTAHSVMVSWLEPLKVHGMLSKYRVSLLASDGTHKRHASVSGRHFSVCLKKLVPYTEYSVRVQVGTQSANELLWSDPNSEIVKFTTRQHHLSEPRNVTAPTEGIMARSFELHWGRPTNPYGNIQFYLIELLESGQTGKFRWNISHSVSSVNSTQEMYAEIPGLSPFTKYKVTVAAVNVENGKEMVGTKSSRIIVKTKDEVPGAPSNCHIARKSNRDILVHWRPPLPNDYNIVFYNVTYTPLRETQEYSRRVSIENIRFDNLLPYTKYHITVAAVTNNTKLFVGEPCRVTERTMIGALPIPDGPRLHKVASDVSSSIAIALPKSNTTNIPIHTEVVIVELRPGVQWSENTTFPTRGDSRVVPSYVVKRLSSDHKGDRIVIGSEQGSDIRLQPDRSYAIFIRWVAQEDNGTERTSTSLTNVHFTVHQPSSSSSSSTTVWIFAAIAAVVVLVVIVVVILFIRSRRMRAPSKEETKNEIPEELGLPGDNSIQVKKVRVKIMDESKEPACAYSMCVIEDKTTTESVINEFEQHVEQLKQDDGKGFTAEFDDLAAIGRDQSSAYARQRDHAKKNRYQNIVPYDGNRVLLEELEGMSILETDFINATYLDSFSKDNAYLVTQGPLPTTCHDFWRMIWLNKPSAIIMLTRTVENGRHKCKQYWSDSEPQLYNGLSVEVVSTVELADYTMRSMRLQLLGEECTIKHYHFKSWPDHGVPTYATDLLGLIYRVRRETAESGSPLLVHCSAGVGRSGTYITIDMLLDYLKSEEVQEINIRQIVSGLRMKRMEMVQSVPQYILIHEAVLEAFYTQKSEIKASQFCEEFSRLQSEQPTGRKIDEEFEILLKLSPPPDESAFGTARLPTVLGRKNRSSKFVAPDTVRVMLRVDDDSPDANYANTTEGADYINASFVNSYFGCGAFIVTQAPLSSTKTDLWKMVYEQNATTIINLAQPHEQEIYWPESGSQSYGQFNIELLSSETRNAFALHKLWLSKKHTDVNIALFHYTAWPVDGPPSDFAGLLEMISQFDQWKKQSGGHCAVVHCCTGMGRSGIFCAAYNALDQLQNEGVVNILQATKVLRNQRPGIIETSEHYETVYRIVNQYMRSSSVYANVK